MLTSVPRRGFSVGVAALTVALLLALTGTAGVQPALAASQVVVPVGRFPNAVAFSPSGGTVFVTNAGDDTVSFVSTTTGAVIRTVPAGPQPTDIAITPDGSRVVITNATGSMTVLSTSTGAKVGTVSGFWNPRSIAILPDGSKAWVANFGASSIAVVDLANLTISSTIASIDGARFSDPYDLATSADGSTMYAASSPYSSQTVLKFDTRSESLVGTFFPGSLTGIAVSPDGATLLTAGWGHVNVLDTEFHTAEQTITAAFGGEEAFAFTPVGSHVYAAVPGGDAVEVYDMALRARVDSISVGDSPIAIAVSPTGAFVAVANQDDNTLSLIPRTEPDSVPASIGRLQGASRYETATEISRSGFPDGATVVYVATGENYPDALSAAPAAASDGGPLLLTPSDSLPSGVGAEILRLRPTTIVVVGGLGAISEHVRDQLRSLTASPLVELAAADRYSTSRLIVQYAFGDGAPVVYLATGAAFPDALSAGAAAGKRGAPVLLVPGTDYRPDSPTLDLIRDLGTNDLVVVGGPGRITYDYMYGFIEAPNHVSSWSRAWGMDRYSTSQNVNDLAFDSAATVYLATGSSFPDALAGAALAGGTDSALFVIPSS